MDGLQNTGTAVQPGLQGTDRAVARVQMILAAFARWNHSLQGLENQYCYCPGRASMDSSWSLLIINGTRGSKRSRGLDRINMYVRCPRYGILYL